MGLLTCVALRATASRETLRLYQLATAADACVSWEAIRTYSTDCALRSEQVGLALPGLPSSAKTSYREKCIIDAILPLLRPVHQHSIPIPFSSIPVFATC